MNYDDEAANLDGAHPGDGIALFGDGNVGEGYTSEEVGRSGFRKGSFVEADYGGGRTGKRKARRRKTKRKRKSRRKRGGRRKSRRKSRK